MQSGLCENLKSFLQPAFSCIVEFICFDCENSRFHEIFTVKFVDEDEAIFGKICMDADFRPRSDGWSV